VRCGPEASISQTASRHQNRIKPPHENPRTPDLTIAHPVHAERDAGCRGVREIRTREISGFFVQHWHVAASEDKTMARHPCQNHSPAFRAKLAVAAVKGERPGSSWHRRSTSTPSVYPSVAMTDLAFSSFVARLGFGGAAPRLILGL
jgi:hypothetical protein